MRISAYETSTLEELIALKEKLKDELVQPMHWQKRMELYRKVQVINQFVKGIVIG